MSVSIPFSAAGSVDFDVLVSQPYSLEEFDLHLELDTASALTSIPRTVLARLMAPHVALGFVTLFDGSERDVDLYEVDIQIGPRLHRPVRVIAIAGDEGILGRDIINQHVFTWDGPGRLLLWDD